MRFLLDTHTLLWYWWNHPQLSSNVLQIIRDSNVQKLVSLVTPWEVAIKVSLGKLDIGGAYPGSFARGMSRDNFDYLIPTNEHCSIVARLPFHHRDPFDRLMIAQAIVEQIPIISADAALDAYPILRIW